MEVEFLGTGTSMGVPFVGCECEVCRSQDPRDKRLRCSAIVRVDGVNLLIDCGPDFRQQMLRASDNRLDALLMTHTHYDHSGGMDDLRPYTYHKPLPVMHYKLPIFGYRIGNLAYITDAKTIPPTTMQRLQGVDTLIINALRFKPHPSHFSLEEALEVIKKVSPRRAYLIHMSDGIGLHASTSRLLPAGVELAYDTEIIRL